MKRVYDTDKKELSVLFFYCRMYFDQLYWKKGGRDIEPAGMV